ncbi:hypothetical protein CR513_43124, partial [Mucuna pruriens]
MVDNVSSNFFDLVIKGERIEARLRSGKIAIAVNGNSLAKKAIPDKKKGDTNTIMTTKTEQSTYRPIFRTSQYSPSFQPTAAVGLSFTSPTTSTTTTTDAQGTQLDISQRRNNPRDGDGPRPVIIHYTSTESSPRPLEIQIPAPFPYTSSQVVPWRYTSRIELTPTREINIAGVGGITRSNQVYAPEDTRKEGTSVQESQSYGKKK